MSQFWLEGLNARQREAVTHESGPLLIIAGAGTGKTRTLACRVGHLIAEGVPPERLLLLTFTRRAAAEMLARADHLTGRQASGKVWGGTFHAVGNRLLRIYGRALGLLPDFTVMDQGDAADMMNLIRNELGLNKGQRRFPRKQTLVSIYSRVVSGQDKLSEVLAKYFPWCEDDIDGISQVFDLYMQRKRENNVLDYDDLLLYWKVLSESPDAGDHLAGRFDHILVDEYQDTNQVQSGILRAMRRKNNNICVVGDDAQSIYAFRAATIRNILDFPKQFPGTHVVTLEQNYRSTQAILDASNTVMDQAKERFTKNLWSQRQSDQLPSLITCVDEADQTEFVCDRILENLERGTPLMKQAVLFRAGHHSDQLEVELLRRNIPYHKYGGLKFIESAHIKDMLAFLRVLENPHDQLSWFRILLLLDGVGPKTARSFMNSLGVGQRSGSQSANEADQADGTQTGSPLNLFIDGKVPFPKAAKKVLQSLQQAFADCISVNDAAAESQGSAPASTGPTLASQVERLRRFYDPIFERSYDNHHVRVRDLEQLEQIALRYKSRQQFITDLTLDPPTSTADLAGTPFLEEDYLILSTIHSAKGCEWDAVYVIHAADGMIPSDMSTGSEEEIEEERRLLYVAMTRARDTLVICFPLRYYHTRGKMRDAHSYAQLTRFLPESMHHLFDRQGQKSIGSGDDQVDVLGVQDLQARLKQLWQR